MADEFILFDSVQYTRRDWRNRNRIKTPGGIEWLTIPVEVKGRYCQSIRETKIADKNWAGKHWKTICYNYSKSKYFKDYRVIFEDAYLNSSEKYLSDINYRFIRIINEILGIKTKVTPDSEFEYRSDLNKTQMLIHLCKSAGGGEYISGRKAENYIEEEFFKKENILLTWMDYSGYPEYSQLYPPFEHGVSIIDLIFNEGPRAKKFMKNNVKKSTP